MEEKYTGQNFFERLFAAEWVALTVLLGSSVAAIFSYAKSFKNSIIRIKKRIVHRVELKKEIHPRSESEPENKFIMYS